MRTGRAWLGAVVVAAGLAACGKGSRRSGMRDDAGPAEASPDARWRGEWTFGSMADVLPLFERDCPNDVPPYDSNTGLGRQVTDEYWSCEAPVRTGVTRTFQVVWAAQIKQPERVASIQFGFRWSRDAPRPRECETQLEGPLFEYLTKVVKNDDGVALTADDLERVRRSPDPQVELSTGPLRAGFGAVSMGTSSSCYAYISSPIVEDPWDPRRGGPDAGSP